MSPVHQSFTLLREWPPRSCLLPEKQDPVIQIQSIQILVTVGLMSSYKVSGFFTCLSGGGWDSALSPNTQHKSSTDPHRPSTVPGPGVQETTTWEAWRESHSLTNGRWSLFYTPPYPDVEMHTGALKWFYKEGALRNEKLTAAL